MRLYELTDEYRRLQAALLEWEGVEDEETREVVEATLTPLLEAVADGLAEKSDGYVAIMRELDAEAEMFRAEADRMTRKAQTRTNALNRLKARLQEAMEQLGLDRIDGPLFTVRLQASPPACQVTDEDAAIVAGFGEVVEQRKLDRRAIIAAWKADPGRIAGFATVEVRRHLRMG